MFFLIIPSSYILSTCAYQFALLHLIQIIILLDSTFFHEVFTSLFIKQQKIKNSSKVLRLDYFLICLVLPASGLVSAAYVSIGLTIVLYIRTLASVLKNLFDQIVLLRQPDILMALIVCLLTSVSRSC